MIQKSVKVLFPLLTTPNRPPAWYFHTEKKRGSLLKWCHNFAPPPAITLSHTEFVLHCQENTLVSELLSAVIAFVSMTTVTDTYCCAPQLLSEESGSCLSCSQLLPLSDVELVFITGILMCLQGWMWSHFSLTDTIHSHRWTTGSVAMLHTLKERCL